MRNAGTCHAWSVVGQFCARQVGEQGREGEVTTGLNTGQTSDEESTIQCNNALQVQTTEYNRAIVERSACAIELLMRSVLSS